MTEEVDIAGDLPNGDEGHFVDSGHHRSETPLASSSSANNAIASQISGNDHNLNPADVFVATSQGLISAQQFQDATGVGAGIKTTHIVIHDQTLDQLTEEAAGGTGGLKSPTTPLPPPTPATPLSKEKGFRYQWDDGVHNDILPVRCKHSNGELHKLKFGSGNFLLYLHCLFTFLFVMLFNVSFLWVGGDFFKLGGNFWFGISQK